MSDSINHSPIIDQFFGALEGRSIQGVNPQVALTTDLYRLYVAWAARVDLPTVKSAPWLCRYLRGRHGIRVALKRYAAGPLIKGPHSVVYLAGPVSARYGMEPEILGRQILSFSSQVDAYMKQSSLRDAEEPLQDRMS